MEVDYARDASRAAFAEVRAAAVYERERTALDEQALGPGRQFLADDHPQLVNRMPVQFTAQVEQRDTQAVRKLSVKNPGVAVHQQARERIRAEIAGRELPAPEDVLRDVRAERDEQLGSLR